MSTIGEFLREMMPSWLGRPPRDRMARRPLRSSGAQADSPSPEDARRLARMADEIWQECVDEGLHGEAFPEPIPQQRARPTSARRKDADDRRDKPAGSNGPH